MANKINSLIGSDISINGDIVYEGSVHIESNITGSLTAYKDKKSKLYINKSSVVNGNIIATDVAINGKIHGNVYAYDLIQLGSEAFVKGDIYYKAIEMLETTAPIRILGYNITEENQKELELYIFHPNQISSSEIFLLSGDEYVNLSAYQNENEPLFNVIIPDHWTTVDLMMDDIFIQTCPIIFNESIYFTLNGDFIPKNDHLNIRVGLAESSLWINELTWNPYTKNLHLEVAGNPEYADDYLFTFKGESIWDVEMFSGYENQFQDSSIILQEEIEYPTFISFMKNLEEGYSALEYIVLDTLPVAISRMPDGGPWYYSESTTLGITNEPVRDYFETDLLPELFVLYQNFPNPFNGQTKITFDLLEDATVSLYITDATGRIHDKFMEDEFITSGTYNYNWNGEGRSTGIYFFTIQAQVDQRPPAIFSRKMIYLK